MHGELQQELSGIISLSGVRPLHCMDKAKFVILAYLDRIFHPQMMMINLYVWDEDTDLLAQSAQSRLWTCQWFGGNLIVRSC